MDTTVDKAHFPRYGIRIGRKVQEQRLPRQSSSFFKPSSASILFLKPESRLNALKQLVDRMCGTSSELELALSLAKNFRSMMDNKNWHHLGAWIENVRSSGIREINGFASGLLKDYRFIKMRSAFLAATARLRAT